MNRVVFRISLLIIALLLLTGFAFFQIENQVSLSDVDLSSFPQVSFLMDPWDNSGNFISGLTAEDMLALENEQEIEINDLQELNLGAQIVIAHNDGSAFTVSGDDDIPRSEILSDKLLEFFEILDTDSSDSIGLVTPDGIRISGQQNKNEIISSWEEYEHDFFETLPNLNVLSQAIDLASDPAPAQGMGKAVLFLTPLIELDQAEIVQDLVNRAVQSRIRLHIGFIGRVADFESEEAAMLRNASDQTGGQYFNYSLIEDIPDFNSMFESSRRAYQAFYTSAVNTSGENQISVVIDTGAGNISSEVENFEINIQAPNPIFLSLPGSIERHFPEEKEILLRNLEPKKFDLDILIDFPDTHPREIISTSLYVNGELVAENKSAPFDEFTLNIEKYQQEMQLMLKVAAEDELGLIGESLDIPVRIMIKDPAPDFSEVFSSNVTDLIVVVVAASLAIGILFLILTGRLRPLMRVERLYKRAKQVNITDKDLDKSNFEEKERTGPLVRIRSSGDEEHIVLAELHIVDAETGKYSGGKHNISKDEVYIGSDIAAAVIVIDDPTIEGRHAQIRMIDEGKFILSDHNTTAGTWLNYDQVSEEGQLLKHGDIIHFGAQAFRFQLPDQNEDPEIEIRYIDDGEKT